MSSESIENQYMRECVHYFLWVYGKNANIIVQILAIPYLIIHSPPNGHLFYLQFELL